MLWYNKVYNNNIPLQSQYKEARKTINIFFQTICSHNIGLCNHLDKDDIGSFSFVSIIYFIISQLNDAGITSIDHIMTPRFMKNSHFYYSIYTFRRTIKLLFVFHTFYDILILRNNIAKQPMLVTNTLSFKNELYLETRMAIKISLV